MPIIESINQLSFKMSCPIGFIYVQFAGQQSPTDLFDGTWQNISGTFAGLFFRAEGGSAAAFGSNQSGGLPNISGEFILGSTGTQNLSATGCFYTGGTTGGDDNNGKNSSPTIGLNASRSSSLYGAATEVRPVNSTIRIWKRIS